MKLLVPASVIALVIAALGMRLDAAQETSSYSVAGCESLNGMVIPPSAIGLPTSGAEVQAASQASCPTPRTAPRVLPA